MGKKAKKNKSDVTSVQAAESGNEPIKLVLRVGGIKQSEISNTPSPATVNDSDEDASNSTTRSRSRKRKIAASPTPSIDNESNLSESLGISAGDYVTSERALRERRKPLSPKIDRESALKDSLLYLQRLMERRDNQHFFLYPVNDLIAPDYSKVIKQSMDFSTTKLKIEQNQYSNIMEYKKDVRLICVNAMTYNHPETIYYQSAMKLLEYAMKTMSKDRLLQMRKSLPQMANISDAQLAFHLDVDAGEFVATGRSQKKKKDKNNYLSFEPIPDHLPPKDILVIAQEKAAQAASLLATKQHNATYGFVHMDAEGTTTLNILNPDAHGYISEKERVITMGEKARKLTTGHRFLDAINVDDDTTLVNPVHYLKSYGYHASSAPTYDSMYANLTKEETDMLLSDYGSQEGLDYVRSLKNFLVDTNSSVMLHIDRMIDGLTGGQHSKAMKKLQENREQDEKAEKKSEKQREIGNEPLEATPISIDFKSLQSLSDLGINTDFLEYFKNPTKPQTQLDNVSQSLQVLAKEQKQKLSAVPSNEVYSASDTDAQQAFEIADKLKDLTSQVKPADVIDRQSLLFATGLGLEPVNKNSVIEKSDTDSAAEFSQ